MRQYSKAGYDKFVYARLWHLLDMPNTYRDEIFNTYVWCGQFLMKFKDNVGFNEKEKLVYATHFTQFANTRIIPHRHPIVWDHGYFRTEVYGFGPLQSRPLLYDFMLPTPPIDNDARADHNDLINGLIGVPETTPFFSFERKKGSESGYVRVHCLSEADAVLVSAWMNP